MGAAVRDTTQDHRFELDVGDVTAFVSYSITGSVVTLIHTEVPESLSGKGVGSMLVRETLELLRARGAQIVAECPFVAAYIQRHPEYRDLIDDRTHGHIDARLDEALEESFPASDPPAVSSRE